GLQERRPADRDASGGDLALRAARAEPAGDPGEPVALLRAEVARVAYLRRALGLRGENAEDGDLVDTPHGEPARDRRCSQRSATELHVALRLDAPRHLTFDHIDGGAHGTQHVDDPGASRIQAHAGAAHVPAGPL